MRQRAALREPRSGMLDLGDELVVDNFAGGGGASTGIEQALGRPVDVAVNHDHEAIAMHAINHPGTRHLCESVFKVNPEEITGNQPVGLAWFSPDCTHHSKAKGSAPRSPRVRGLAWVVIRWAKRVKPRVIMLENVEEFADWGPLCEEGLPIKEKAGTTFRLWLNQLRRFGYTVEYRQLRACDYGAPTTRKRLFVIARRDGLPITWPEPTHGPGRLTYRSAAECIDWSLQCPSIFERARPLADATLQRIAHGVMRYVVNDPAPFVVGIDHQSSGVSSTRSAREPLTTITAKARHAVVVAFVAKHYTGVIGQTMRKPIGTVTTVDHHSLVQAFLVAYYGSERDGGRVSDPMRTIPTRDRFGLVTVHGEPYRIEDIGMRMLQPRELFRAQGFPEDYIIEFEHRGRRLSKAAQVRMCGNSVCPDVAAALVRANFGHEALMRPAAALEDAA